MQELLNRQKEIFSGMSGRFVEKSLATIGVLAGLSKGITEISNSVSEGLKEACKLRDESEKELESANKDNKEYSDYVKNIYSRFGIVEDESFLEEDEYESNLK